MVDFKDDDQRRAMEEALDNAINKWLDKQFASFGKWTSRGLIALIIAGACWLWFHTQGFKP